MSDSVSEEIAKLQKTLDTVGRRLDQLRQEQAGATVLVPRATSLPWWKRPLAVGVLAGVAASLATLGIGTLVTRECPTAAAPVVYDTPSPVMVTQPCKSQTPTPPVTAVAPLLVPTPPRTVQTPPPPPGSMGSLTVVCLPTKCSEIVDNGVSLGPGHIFSRPTSAGRHTLTLRALNGVTKSVTVDIQPDQLKDVRMSMADLEGF